MSTSELLKALSDSLQKHCKVDSAQPRRLWVAYSGGVDSTVLLHIAYEFAKAQNLLLKAIHINHNLSPNALSWQQHCIDECSMLSVECVVKSVKLEAKGKGLEAGAREARYQAISGVVNQSDVVLLGQHQNDQVETFFLQLMRGSGPAGLSAMPEFTENKFGTHLLRPFMDVSREQLAVVAREQGWKWIEDESNQNTDFDRNYLRTQVLPLIKSRWNASEEVICRSVSHVQEQSALLSEVVNDKLRTMLSEKNQISIKSLTEESVPWQKHILKLWIARQEAVQPSEKILLRILSECVTAREDAQPRVCWGSNADKKWQCRRFSGQLYLLPEFDDLQGVTLPVIPNEPLQLPDNLGSYLLETSDSKRSYQIRFGGFSDSFKPIGERHSKPLNQWFKQWKLPPWERLRTPLLLVDGKLAAVGEVLSVPQSQSEQRTIDVRYSRGGEN